MNPFDGSRKEVDLSRISKLTETQRKVRELRRRATAALSQAPEASSQQVAGAAPAAGAPSENGQQTSSTDSFHARLLGMTERIKEAEVQRRTAQLRGGQLPEKRKKSETQAQQQRAPTAPTSTTSKAPTPFPPAPVAPSKRTLFVPGAPLSMTVCDISDDYTEFVSKLRKDVEDEDRITAPHLTVAVVYENNNTSFSLSSGKQGKMHFHVLSRVLEQVESVLIHYDQKIYVAHRMQGIDLLLTILTELRGIDVHTFHTPALLIPLLLRSKSLRTRCIRDIKTMAWMLTPNDSCSSIDSLFANYISNARFPSPEGSYDGVVERIETLNTLYFKLNGLLGRQQLLLAFQRVERHLPLILCKMKLSGFHVDAQLLLEHKSSIEQDMATKREAAASFAPPGSTLQTSFNIQSSDDCRALLYDHLKLDQFLPEDAKTKTGKITTSEEALKSLSEHHELPGLIIAYRKLAKVNQTYIDGLLEHAVPSTDESLQEIHANYLQESTDTGRLSCSEPNMQNLPRTSESEVNGFVRKAFVAPPGFNFVAIDYKQIEVCVLAHFCGDPVMTRTLNLKDAEKNDLHKAVASLIYNKPVGDIESDQRTAAKRVVFGVMYGIGPKALAAQLEKTVEEAARIQQRFNEAFPSIQKYRQSELHKARQTGFVKTFAGRWRPLPDINSSNTTARANAERQAFNTIIQGTAADIVKKAMVEVSEILESSSPNAELVGQVHDELVFRIPDGEELALIPRLKTCMETIVKLNVSLSVTVSCGQSLGTLKEVC